MKEFHMKKTRNFKSSWIMLGMLMVVLGAEVAWAAGCTGSNYGSYDCPFTSASIWNLPIQAGAVREAVDSPPYTAYSSSVEGINRFSAAYPLVTIYKKIDFGEDACVPTNVDATKIVAKIRLPGTFFWTDNMTDGGRSAFVMPDNAGEHRRAGVTTPLRTGDVVEFYGFERCPGMLASASFLSTLPHHLTGNGYPEEGMQLGSELSVLGGELRAGELISPRSARIGHALKLAIPNSVKYYAPDLDGESLLDGPGYVWPAKTQDGNAATTYVGTDPRIKIGRLYTLATSFNCDTLKTVPGQKICDAMKTYGAYDADTNGGNLFRIRIQMYDPGHQVVLDELNAIGINAFYISWANSDCAASTLTKKFGCDMKMLWQNLRVVTNTSPTNPKGGSAPSNLLTNHDFEFGTQDWTLPASAVITTTSSEIHGGTKAAEMPYGSWAAIRQTKPAFAGRTYTLSGWIKTNNFNGGALLRVDFLNSSGDILTTHTTNAVNGTTNYIKYTKTATAPSATVNIKVQLVRRDGTTGYAWFDDISVTTP